MFLPRPGGFDGDTAAIREAGACISGPRYMGEGVRCRTTLSQGSYAVMPKARAVLAASATHSSRSSSAAAEAA